MNDFKEFQDFEPICSGKLYQRLRSDSWNLSGTMGNVFLQSTSSNRFITDTLSRNFSLYGWIKVLLVEPSAKKYRSWAVKNKLEAQLLCPFLQEGHQPWILFCQWKFHRILLLDSKDRYRSFSLTNYPLFLLDLIFFWINKSRNNFPVIFHYVQTLFLN